MTTNRIEIIDLRKLSPVEKFNITWNLFFTFLFFSTIIGSYFLYKDVTTFTSTLKSKNPNYNFPSYSDLQICIPLSIIIIVTKILLESIFVHFTHHLLDSSYKDPKSKRKIIEGKIISQKLSTYIFKIIYYFLITIFGYSILSQTNYFPKSLYGNGNILNLFIQGYPNSFYHIKPKYFDLYYLINLSYVLTEFIYLLFIYIGETDFINMVVHHVCTVSLLGFSYVTNFSHVGAVILFLHNQSDIFVYVTRFIIRVGMKDIYRDISGFLLMGDFVWVRLIVFGGLILKIYSYISWKWDRVIIVLWVFLIFLYTMHVNWTLRFVGKLWKRIQGISITDITSMGASRRKTKV